MVDRQCRESKGKAKIEGYMSVSDEKAHQWEGGHRHDSSGVWVIDCDHLILIAVVPDNTLNQYVEWLAQEDIVCWVANNVELNI